MIGASFVFVSPPVGAPPAHDLADDNLSLWLRSDGITGTGPTFNWAGEASTGSSASHSLSSYPAYDDEVESAAGAFDSFAAAVWPNSGNYPKISSSTDVKELLGAVDNVAHSYTVAVVLQPVSSSSGDLSLGRVTVNNPSIFDGLGSYFAIVLLDIGGAPFVGVYHYDVDLGPEGTVPVAWTPGWGGWGLLLVSYNSTTSTITIRINGSVVHTGTLNPTRGVVALGGVACMGATGGGAYKLAMQSTEVAVWPDQCLDGASAELRETYFADRYPSLGM